VDELDEDYEKWKAQVRKGLLEYAVFKVLQEGESYGYEILQSVQSYTSMQVTESAIYPILAKSAKEGLLSAHKMKSPSGPSRRYYTLTPQGKVWLAKMNVFIQQLNNDFS